MAIEKSELDTLQANWGKFVDDPWPTGLLILRKALTKGYGRNDVARLLGGGSHGQAHAYLDGCVNARETAPKWRVGLLDLLSITPAEIEAAEEGNRLLARRLQEEAERRREKAERTAFVPHAWVIPENRIPSPLFVAAFYGQNRFLRVDLPADIASLPREEQNHLLGRAIRGHFLEKDGKAGPFGRILGYLHRRTYDETAEFSIEGELLDPLAQRPHQGIGTLRVSDRVFR
jgi:hypothetical protein